MRTPTELAEAFRARGLKVTPQRQLLFGLLDGNGEHPTAEALYAEASARMPGISLRTVYTTLSDLVEMGELTSLCLDNGAMRFDPNVDEHHHLVCNRCAAVVDVYVDGADQLRIDGLGDFRHLSTSIVFHGTCGTCGSADTVADTADHPIP